MNHIMFCVSGFSGVGKDEFTSVLKNEYGAIQTGLVDPAKRHMADIYGFSEQQLFGPSKNRNAGDLRYPKPEFYQKRLTTNLDKFLSEDGREVLPCDPTFWLSPREALQKYCELMNTLYSDTWVRKAFETHQLIGNGHYDYNRMTGLSKRSTVRDGRIITAMADFRHVHEVDAAKRVKASRVVLVRIKSQRVPSPPFNHRSETEQVSIPDSDFHFVINNDGSVEDLHKEARRIVNEAISSE